MSFLHISMAGFMKVFPGLRHFKKKDITKKNKLNQEIVSREVSVPSIS